MGHSCWPEVLFGVTGQSCWLQLLVANIGQSYWLEFLVACFAILHPALSIVVCQSVDLDGCDMSGRVYSCSCTVTVDLPLGSQAGLISSKISISSWWPFKSHKHDIFDPSKALIAGLRVNIA